MGFLGTSGLVPESDIVISIEVKGLAYEHKKLPLLNVDIEGVLITYKPRSISLFLQHLLKYLALHLI